MRVKTTENANTKYLCGIKRTIDQAPGCNANFFNVTNVIFFIYFWQWILREQIPHVRCLPQNTHIVDKSFGSLKDKPSTVVSISKKAYVSLWILIC